MEFNVKENVLAACEQILWRNRRDNLTVVKLYTKTNHCFLFDKDTAGQLVQGCSGFVSTSNLFEYARLHPDYNGFGDIKQTYNKYKTAFIEVDVSKDILQEFEEIVKSRTHLLTYEVVLNVAAGKTNSKTATITTEVVPRDARILCSAEFNKFYRVVTFQSKEVVDTLLRNEVYLADLSKAREGSICQEDIDNCSGKIPIWVFQHPAFCFDKVGNHQFCNMLETFRCEMSISSLNDLYMIELHLDYQPPIGKAHNGCSLACVIPSISLNEVAGIYKLNQTEFFFYDIIPYKLYSSKCLFEGVHSFNKAIYKKDNLPTLTLSKFKNDKEYYDYDKVLHAYVLDIVSSNSKGLLVGKIINLLPKRVLSLEELYRETTRIINQSSQELTTDSLAVIQKRTTVTPDENPFDYNPETRMLTILGKTNAKIRIGTAGMVDFMHSIKPLLENRYKPYSGNDINNTLEALRDSLIKENYVKLPGPVNCEVWGCFNNDIENLLMLEIIYPYTGSRHINVALDLSKF